MSHHDVFWRMFEENEDILYMDRKKVGTLDWHRIAPSDRD